MNRPCMILPDRDWKITLENMLFSGSMLIDQLKKKYIYIYIYVYQVNDLVKLGFLILMIRTYYSKEV